MRHQPSFWFAALLLAILASMTVAPALWVAPSPASPDPHACSIRSDTGEFQDRLPPSSEHWFGTDLQGCDYYTQVIYGTRASMVTGLVAVLIGGAIAIAFGGLAGFVGGWVDGSISRFTDVIFGIPAIVFAILLLNFISGENHSVLTVALVLGLLGWPFALRLVRSSVQQVRSMPFIDASRLHGATTRRTITRHVLPNALMPMIGYMTLAVGGAIVAEAGLSFLGVGLQAPTISWGQMIGTAQQRLSDLPYLLFFPSFFLSMTVLAFLIAGDVLRRHIDPSATP